jgi:hypothetical protein
MKHLCCAGAVLTEINGNSVELGSLNHHSEGFRIYTLRRPAGQDEW